MGIYRPDKDVKGGAIGNAIERVAAVEANKVTGAESLTITSEYLLSAAFGASLPVTDPLVVGEAWNNAGVVTISAG